jgi:hypothetical protein
MKDQQSGMKGMGWARFAGMIATSTVVMFFLMYQLVYSADHATFSVNRLIASLVMACVMTIVMLGFMWSMYHGQRVKVAVLVRCCRDRDRAPGHEPQPDIYQRRLFHEGDDSASLHRNQQRRKASISDPRVRELADEIIEAQVREIAEMKLLIRDIERNGERGTGALPARPATLTPEMERDARDAVQ